MRILDAERKHGVRTLQLYVTAAEATELRDELTKLLATPEAEDHFHVFAEDMSREFSCSIVTPEKLRRGAYNVIERRILAED